MDQLPMRVRFLNGIAVVGVGKHAAGEPFGQDGLVGCCREHSRVVLDMAGAEFVSSEWLGHMIRAHQMATTSGCQWRICCPAGMMREVFGITRLDRLTVIYPTLSEALASFDPPAG
jgi:anti-anti-sigma regulatory factor